MIPCLTNIVLIMHVTYIYIYIYVEEHSHPSYYMSLKIRNIYLIIYLSGSMVKVDQQSY